MALLLSPTVSFLVSPAAPRSRALSATANVSYPSKLRWRASSIPSSCSSPTPLCTAVLAGWGRFLGWISCPTICNPRSTADVRFMVDLIVRRSSLRRFCAAVMLLARLGISSNINRAASSSTLPIC